MSFRFLIYRIPGAALYVGSFALILVGAGIVDAQLEPPFKCWGNNIDGCSPTGCTDAGTSVCNDANWVKKQRLNYQYRECSGPAGKCEGFSNEFAICKSYFFDGDNPTCPINNPQCTIITAFPACPPNTN